MITCMTNINHFAFFLNEALNFKIIMALKFEYNNCPFFFNRLHTLKAMQDTEVLESRSAAL